MAINGKYILGILLTLQKTACLTAVFLGALLTVSLVPRPGNALDLGSSPVFSGTTGGFIRFPNSLELNDKGNRFGVMWFKENAEIFSTDKTSFSLNFLGTYSRDTHPYVWNNAYTLGFGAELSTKITSHLKLTAILRHDRFTQLDGVVKEATRYYLNYSYFRNWNVNSAGHGYKFRLSDIAANMNGSLAFPSSFENGDNNVLFTSLMEITAELKAEKTKLVIVPFMNLDLSWDRNANNYNNKAVKSLGIRLRYPISKGKVYIGLSYGSDARWIDNTNRSGLGAILGWNKDW